MDNSDSSERTGWLSKLADSFKNMNPFSGVFQGALSQEEWGNERGVKLMKSYLSIMQNLHDKKKQPLDEAMDHLFLESMIHSENALDPDLKLEYLPWPSHLDKHTKSKQGDFESLAIIHPNTTHTSVLSIRRKDGKLSFAHFDSLYASYKHTAEDVLTLAEMAKKHDAVGASFPFDVVRAPNSCQVQAMALAKKLRSDKKFLSAVHDVVEARDLYGKLPDSSWDEDQGLSELDDTAWEASGERFSVFPPDDVLTMDSFSPETTASLYINATSPNRLEKLYGKSKKVQNILSEKIKGEVRENFGKYLPKIESKRPYFLKRSIHYHQNHPEVPVSPSLFKLFPGDAIHARERWIEATSGELKERIAKNYLQDIWKASRGKDAEIADLSFHLARDTQLQDMLRDKGSAFFPMRDRQTSMWSGVPATGLTGAPYLTSDKSMIIVKHPHGIGIFSTKDLAVDALSSAQNVHFRMQGEKFKGEITVRDGRAQSQSFR